MRFWHLCIVYPESHVLARMIHTQMGQTLTLGMFSQRAKRLQISLSAKFSFLGFGSLGCTSQKLLFCHKRLWSRWSAVTGTKVSDVRKQFELTKHLQVKMLRVTLSGKVKIHFKPRNGKYALVAVDPSSNGEVPPSESLVDPTLNTNWYIKVCEWVNERPLSYRECARKCRKCSLFNIW